MAIKALIFGIDDIFNQLKPFYEAAVQRGDIDIIGYATIEQDNIKLFSVRGGVDPRHFEIAIISSKNNSYNRVKILERLGVPRNRIIDGRVFCVPYLDLPRLLNEYIAYGTMYEKALSWRYAFPLDYKRIYKIRNTESTVSLGRKTYVNGANIDGDGVLSIGDFCSISGYISFYLGINHNYKLVSHYSTEWWGWDIPSEYDYYQPGKVCKISINSDVWIGRGSILKATNPEKPLIIGDGAVIASDSVVVKNVPPYAIVGGNPAQIIKYRFSDKIIESLLRIQWWNWDIDKIYDNFQYFNRVEEFVEMHDN